MERVGGGCHLVDALRRPQGARGEGRRNGVCIHGTFAGIELSHGVDETRAEPCRCWALARPRWALARPR